MTDREALLALLARFGLKPFTGTEADGWSNLDAPKANQVMLVAHVGGVEGYSDFHARFAFDANGKFEDLGIWE